MHDMIRVWQFFFVKKEIKLVFLFFFHIFVAKFYKLSKNSKDYE